MILLLLCRNSILNLILEILRLSHPLSICIAERTYIIRIELERAFVILNKGLVVRLVIGIDTS